MLVFAEVDVATCCCVAAHIGGCTGVWLYPENPTNICRLGHLLASDNLLS